MEHREGMDMGPGAGASKPEAGKTPETDKERATHELHHRADSLGDSLRSFEKEIETADDMAARIKDPKKREEFKSALTAFRGRTGGIGKSLRAAVTGLALFAGGVGVGKGMDDDRKDAVIVDLARHTASAEAENRMLKSQLEKQEFPNVVRDKSAEKVIDAMAEQNAALRKQLTDMAKELARLRQERDEANARVLAEKEKGLVTQDALFKQQAVSGNLEQLYKKMKALIDGSDDPKLKEDSDRFLAAYE
jgi:hypothetical protein